MYLLDTDHMTVIERGTGDAALKLRDRLRAKTSEAEVEAYRLLGENLRVYAGIAVLSYTAEAADILADLRRAKIRVGTQDLKIAAIALANGATLLSRNTGDFGKVPGLSVEDWTL